MGKEIIGKRRVAIPDFYGQGENIYADQPDWQDTEKKEARSLMSKEIWEYFICTVGLNISFYFSENDTFYGPHTEEMPYTLYKLPRDRKLSLYIGLQCNGDTHEYGEVVFESNYRESLWDNILSGLSWADLKVRNVSFSMAFIVFNKS